MQRGCQKTIKKPLGGNVFASPAAVSGAGCTWADESGMQQPQSWGFLLQPLSLITNFFKNIWRIWLKKKHFFFPQFPSYCCVINKYLKTLQLFMSKLYLFAVLQSQVLPTQPHVGLPLLPPAAKLQSFSISKCVLCGTAQPSAASGGKSFVNYVFPFFALCIQGRYRVLAPLYCFLLAPELLNSSWVSSQGSFSSESLLSGSAWPLLEFQNRKQPYLP